MTDGTTRREFLGSLAAFSFFPFEQEKPELILHNGHVVTMNPAEPVAEAVAGSRGRFFAVGKNADVMNLAGAGVRKMDLGGKDLRVVGFSPDFVKWIDDYSNELFDPSFLRISEPK